MQPLPGPVPSGTSVASKGVIVEAETVRQALAAGLGGAPLAATSRPEQGFSGPKVETPGKPAFSGSGYTQSLPAGIRPAGVLARASVREGERLYSWATRSCIRIMERVP
jgi:hypothetical protein